jgi:hypothetical protein
MGNSDEIIKFFWTERNYKYFIFLFFWMHLKDNFIIVFVDGSISFLALIYKFY